MHNRIATLGMSIRKTFHTNAHMGEGLLNLWRRILSSLSIPAFIRFLLHINYRTVREVVVCTFAQRLPSLSAEMAYYSMLGLFPGILAILTAIGLVEILQESFNRLAWRLSEVAPLEALVLIQNFADEVSNSKNRSLFSISFLIAIWASSGAISAAMRALDQIHQIPHQQLRPFWKAKLVSLGLTVGTILLLIIASSLVFVSDWAVRHVAFQSSARIADSLLTVWGLLTWPLALGIMSSAFSLIYRFGPSRWTRGKPLVPGAILAALSWVGLSSAFRMYVSHFSDYNRVYGAVGTVIVLMLWLYLSSLVLLLGDQLNVSVGRAMLHSRQRQQSYLRRWQSSLMPQRDQFWPVEKRDR